MPQEKEEIDKYFKNIMLLKEEEQLRVFNIIINEDDVDIQNLVALTKYIPKNSSSSSFFTVAPLLVLVNNDTKHQNYILEIAKQRREFLVNRNIEPANLEELTVENTAQMLACMTIYSYNAINNAIKNLSEKTDDSVKAVAKKSFSLVKKGFLDKIKINKVITGKRSLSSIVEDLAQNKVDVAGIINASSKEINKNITERSSKYVGQYVSSILPEYKDDIETAEKAVRRSLVNGAGVAGAIAAPLAAVGAEKIFKEGYASAIATAAVIGVLKGGSAGEIIVNSIATAMHEPIWKAIDSKVALKERKLKALSMPYAALKGLVNKETKKYSKVIITLLIHQVYSYIKNQTSKVKSPSVRKLLFSAIAAIKYTSEVHVKDSGLLVLEDLPDLTKLSVVRGDDSTSSDGLRPTKVARLRDAESSSGFPDLSNVEYNPYSNQSSNFTIPESLLDLSNVTGLFPPAQNLAALELGYNLGIMDPVQRAPVVAQDLQYTTSLSNSGLNNNEFMAAAAVVTIAAKFVVKKLTTKYR